MTLRTAAVYCQRTANKGFLPNIYHELLLSLGVWMYMDTARGLSKSQNISEYCDWCRRQQWCWPIVGVRLCKRTADGRETSSSHSSYKKGHGREEEWSR